LFRCNGASHDIKIPIKQLALRTTPLYATVNFPYVIVGG
jgi:hypothetical protein